MNEYPLICAAWEVQAIRDGSKPQARRVCKELLGQPACNVRYDPPSQQWQRYGAGGVWIGLRSPFGVPGDRLYVKTTLWASDCGRYFAQNVGSISEYDVLDKQTHKRWQWRRYTPTGWHDKDRRHTHPEFAAMVVSWSCETNGFTLGFSDHDTSKRIVQLSGNTILKSYDARFRRRVSSQCCPRWASPLTLERLTDRPPERVRSITNADALAEGVITIYNTSQTPPVPWYTFLGHPYSYCYPVAAFERLWDTRYAKRGDSWDANPFVWVPDFKVVDDG